MRGRALPHTILPRIERGTWCMPERATWSRLARCDAGHDVLEVTEQHVPATFDDVEPGTYVAGRLMRCSSVDMR